MMIMDHQSLGTLPEYGYQSPYNGRGAYGASRRFDRWVHPGGLGVPTITSMKQNVWGLGAISPGIRMIAVLAGVAGIAWWITRKK